MKPHSPPAGSKAGRPGGTINFYWKQRCHTCRTARKNLEARAVPIEPIDILIHPPAKEVLRQLISRYGAKAMIRRNSKEYGALHVSEMRLSEEALATLLHENPDIACRPIVLVGGRAFLSKDPEFARYLQALNLRPS